jgi:hypothetical protein
MPPTLDDSPDQPLPASAYARATMGRAMRRHVALLLLTLSVVVIPNVVSFAASILD